MHLVTGDLPQPQSDSFSGHTANSLMTPANVAPNTLSLDFVSTCCCQIQLLIRESAAAPTSQHFSFSEPKKSQNGRREIN